MIIGSQTDDNDSSVNQDKEIEIVECHIWM